MEENVVDIKSYNSIPREQHYTFSRIFVSMSNISPKPPVLSRHVFWDIDFDELDFDRYANFTIIRIFERGFEEDVNEVIRFYGSEKVVKILTSASKLSPRAKTLGKSYFNLPDENFEY